MGWGVGGGGIIDHGGEKRLWRGEGGEGQKRWSWWGKEEEMIGK